MSYRYDPKATGTRCTPEEWPWHSPLSREGTDSSVERARNTGFDTTPGKVRVIVQDGVVMDVDLFRKAITSGQDYVTYCTRHGYSIDAPVTELASPERITEAKEDLQKVYKAAGARRALYAKTAKVSEEIVYEDNLVSIGAYLSERGEFDEDEETEAA